MNEIAKEKQENTYVPSIVHTQLENMAPGFELLHPFSLLPLLLFLFFIYRWLSPNFTPKKNLPPSPPSLPIIGNLHQLGTLPFRSLQTLSGKYGDLMLLHLGSKPTIVISSAEVASQVLKTHDLVFAGRPNMKIFRRVLGNGKDMVSASYGEYWRQMRSICMLQVLNNKKVRSYRKVREEEVAAMMNDIQAQKVVDLSDMLMSLSNDLTCRAAFGKKYRGEVGDFDFTKLLDEFMKLMGGYYIGDFISWLGWINKINGVESKLNNVTRTFDLFLERILEDHSNRAGERNGGGEENEHAMKDFVDVLLEVQRDKKSEYPLLDRESIKGLILDVFAASSDTTAVHFEWTMVELLRNPRVMQELQKEVSRITGGKEIVTEEDLENMNYLKAVLKESLRLHPPGPLMVPHESTQDIRINGYDISAGTRVVVNVWAISRNPKYWEEPERFYPERFLNSSIDYKGHDFQFTPFGSGRRMCPGVALAIANSELVIANLVHRFDWSLPDGATGESLDMTESFGTTVHKKIPLVVVPSPRIL